MKKVIITMFLLCTSLIFAQLPDGYVSEQLIDTYNSPMDVEFITGRPDMMVIAERAGKIWIADLVNDNWVKRDNPVIDITNQVTTYFERGIQSIIVDRHFIYVYYTVEETYLLPGLNEDVNDDSATINRVSRWEISWPQNIEFGEEILIGKTPSDGIPSTAGNHQGGGMAWGENNMLFVSTGDGGSGIFNQQAIDRGIMRAELNVNGGSKSQIINCLNGKLLRINPWNGDGANGNPFYDSNNRRTPESRVYALGFRNPFDIVGKPYMGVNNQPTTIYVADVGEGNKEEVTLIDKAGLNAGWGLREGFSTRTLSGNNPDEGVPYSDLMSEATSFVEVSDDTQRRFTHHPPELDYGHSGNPLTRLPRFTDGVLDPIIDVNAIEGNSITGGAYISGDGFGENYNGAYIFSDYSRGWLNIGIPYVDQSNDRYFDYIEEFAPINSYPVTIDITQNPIDGSIYIVTLFGDIHRISLSETLSIQTPSLNDEIKIIYDNNTNLNSIVGINNMATLKIYDSLGRFISEDTIYDYHIIDYKLQSGIYIAHIINDSNILVKKFIIK